MDYKVTSFIGSEADNEGWQKIEDKGIVELKNGEEKIRLEIESERAKIEINGNGNVVLIRGNKRVKFTKNALGKIEIGDTIWLLGPEAKEEVEGAAVKIEIRDPPSQEATARQSIFIKERAFSQEKNSISANLILGGVVFLLLIVGTFLGYQKRTDNEGQKKFEEIKSGVEAKIMEIESVRSVNIETALELAQSAEVMLSNTAAIEKKYGRELTELRNKVLEIKGGLGAGDVEYEVAYDTALIKEGDDLFKGMAIKDDLIYLWSGVLGQINVVNPNLKSTEKIVTDERIKLWLGIFNNGEKWYGYDTNKIYEIKRNELVETEIKNIKSLGEMAGWSGLTYVLDNGSQNIMKLNGGEGKIWLKEGTNLSEEMTGMSIDSNIWVLGKSGKIYKYTRGEEEKFNMSAVTSLNTAKGLRTSDKVNFLAYVTDENTVVIYGKDGKISGKYNFSKTKINDIGIENQIPAVLVLAKNGKIYRIKIK